MSVDLQVVLDPMRMPRPSEWASAARGFGFEVDLDTDFDPETFSGFLPCKYKGHDAGFEYYWSALDGQEQGRLGVSQEKSACVTFSTRSNYREFATSMICAAVLAAKTDGTLFDADGATIVPAGTEVDWARESEQSIQEDIARQDRPAATPVPYSAAVKKKPWWKVW